MPRSGLMRGLGSCMFCIGCAWQSAAQASDTLLIHGHIYTGNAKELWAQALAITGTRIDAVGSDQEILARREPKTQVIDLQGRTVIPGISDSHTHMLFGAMALRGINIEPDHLCAGIDQARGECRAHQAEPDHADGGR